MPDIEPSNTASIFIQVKLDTILLKSDPVSLFIYTYFFDVFILLIFSDLINLSQMKQ